MVGEQCKSTKWKDVYCLRKRAQWSCWVGQHCWELGEGERDRERELERVAKKEWRWWKWKLEIAGKDRGRNRQSAFWLCLQGYYLPHLTKRRIIIRGLLLYHHDFIPFTGTDTPCRLSLISFTLLNQYTRNHTKQWHEHPVVQTGETQEEIIRKDEVLTDKMREENDVEWHFCGREKKKHHALIKTCSHVYLLLRLSAWARFICLHLAAPQGEKQVGWSLSLAVYQAIVPSCLTMLWDIMQLSSLFFWAAELSAPATLMVMWWIGIQERSLSLSLSASGYWPSQAQLSSLTLLSESITACSELQGSSESTSRLSGTFFDLVCSGSISVAAMLKSMLILSK